jgi:hypothetical protein
VLNELSALGCLVTQHQGGGGLDDDVVKEADVMYVTRMQKERHLVDPQPQPPQPLPTLLSNKKEKQQKQEGGEEKDEQEKDEEDEREEAEEAEEEEQEETNTAAACSRHDDHLNYSSMVVDPPLLAKAKPSMVLMHPLPRVGEIDEACDSDPRAAYFRQMENGMCVKCPGVSLSLSLSFFFLSRVVVEVTFSSSDCSCSSSPSGVFSLFWSPHFLGMCAWLCFASSSVLT